MFRNQTFKRCLLFGALIFLLLMAGQRTAHGYLHAADPFMMLSALYLPLPHSLILSLGAGLIADLAKTRYLLIPASLLIRAGMILLIRLIRKHWGARKNAELAYAPVALLPVAGYYFYELLMQLFAGKGAAAFALAASTLRKDLIQGVAGILIFILVKDAAKALRRWKKGWKAAVAEAEARQKEKEDTSDE